LPASSVMALASPSTATNNDLITRDWDGNTLTGTLSKALSTGERLQISRDGGVTWTTLLSDSGTNWTYTLEAGIVSEVALTVSFRIIDAAGNIANTALMPNKTIVNDYTPPSDITVAPVVTGTLVNGGTVTVSGSGGTLGDYVALVQDANFDGVYEENVDKILGWAKISDTGSWSFIATVASGLTNLAFMSFDDAGNRSRLSPVTTVAVPEATGIMNMNWGSGNAGYNGRAQTGSMALSQTGGWLFFQPTTSYGANLYTQQDSGWQNITTLALPKGNFGSGYGATYTGSTFADLDRNGYVDMVNTPSDYSSENFNVYSQSATGWTQKTIPAGDAVHLGVTIAFDKEGDGWLDIVSGDAQDDGITFIYNNNGALTPANGNGRPNNSAGGIFTPVQGTIMKGASTIDIDNDGKVDIAGHIGQSNGAQNLGFYYNYNPATQSFSLKYLTYVLRDDGNDNANDIEPKETWADFNGDGYLDLFLSRGAAINTSGAFGSGNSDESRVLYNNGAGSLNTSAGTFTRLGDSHSGVLSFAVDWNMDGKMDVVEMPKNVVGSGTGGGSVIQLWTNTGVSGGKANFIGSTLGNQTGVLGSMAADINWDGSVDLIMMTATTAKVLLNPNVAPDGTSLHLRIVDQNGINVFYGNTVNLYDSHGNLVSTQQLNPQGSATDSSGLLNFYGLDPNETYSVQLLRVTNGAKNFTGDGNNFGNYTESTVNATWGGLKAGSAHDAYMLTAESTTAANDSQQFGTGYNDTFFSTPGNDKFDGAGGWTKDFGNGSQWVANGGEDYVDYSRVAGPINANLATGVATGDGTDTLVNIEGLIGSQFDDIFTGSGVDNFFDGRGGNDTFNLGTGGHTTLLYKLLDATDSTGGNGHDVANGFHIGEVKTDADADLIDLSQLFANTPNMPVLSGYVDSDGVFKLDWATDKNDSAISDYLRVTTVGADTVIYVDLKNDGGASFAAILTLTNVHTTLEQLVQNHQIVIG